MSNLELVQDLYRAFGQRDGVALRKLLHPDIEWIQNDGFPEGGKHVGADAVLNGVFARFREHWESWEAAVTEWLDAGLTIVAIGEYRGTYKETRRTMTAAFAHIYTVEGGQIVRFRQYTDTLQIHRAMQAP